MAFNIPNQTSYILQRPVNPFPRIWVRPSDWIAITDTTNEIQFLVSDIQLPAIYRIETTYTKPAAQNLYIDWGDGTVDTVSTATATSTTHTYTTGGTACSVGYNTWKIRVYVDAGATLTQATHLIPTAFGSMQPISGLLEEYYGNGTITTAQYLHNNSTTRPLFYNLQYSKLPATITTNAAIFQETYTNCQSLGKVVLPTSAPNATSITNMFQNCFNLTNIVLPQDMSGSSLTTMSNAFYGCYSLTGLTLPPALPNVTTLQSTFFGCQNLSSIKLPTLPACSNFNGTFQTAKALITVEIPQFFSGSSGSIDFTACFNGCTSLEYVKMPTYVNPTPPFYAASMFLGCLNLKSFIFPPNANLNTISSAFQTCYSLATVSLPMTTSLTDMTNMFSSCNNLQEITLPTTIGASVNMTNTFNACGALSKVNIPSSYNITSMQGAFQNCSLLNTCTLPTTQNSLLNMFSTFNGCNSLVNLTLPTSMSSLNQMPSCFLNCWNLTGITIPSNSTLITSYGNSFQNCYNLTNVSLPTTSVATTFANMFSGAYRIKNVVLPNSTGVLTTMSNTFTNCYALQNATLPTTQSTSITTINSIFNNAISLTGTTNVDKIGSTSTGSTIYVDGSNAGVAAYELPTLDFYTKFSKLTLNGISTRLTKLTSLRLRNNGSGQYAGTSPQIDISYTSLGQAALVQVFNDLPTITAKTINITGASGAAALTAGERAIATGKGWTITG